MATTNQELTTLALAGKYQKMRGVGSALDPFLPYHWASIDSAHDIQQAINVIESIYGVTVSVDAKKKSLSKFGYNPNVGSTGRYTIWYTGQDQAHETYVAANTNSISTISSSSTSDVTKTVKVEGHTESGGNKTFVIQEVTLNGQNKVTLTTPLNRCTRVHNTSSTDLVGEIYVYEDTAISAGKPTDTTKIHITVPAGENQSQKCSTSLSSIDFWIVTSFHAGYNTKSGTNTADVRLEVRESGGVFKPSCPSIMVTSGGESDYNFDPYLVVPKNADVRITANASALGQNIIGGIQGYLATIV